MITNSLYVHYIQCHRDEISDNDIEKLNELINFYQKKQQMKIKCIYHSIDLDGWCSGAIVKKWATQNNFEIELIGYNHGESIPEKLEDADMLIICDMSFTKEAMDKLHEKYGKKLIWIDHHKSAIDLHDKTISGLRTDKYAACELTWKYLFPDVKVPIIVNYLGLYDSFRSKNTPEHEKILQFQYYARSVCNSIDIIPSEWISPGIDRNKLKDYIEKGKAIYEYLCKEALMKFKLSHPVDIDGHMFIMYNGDRFNPINFGIRYHDKGYEGAGSYYYNGENFIVSLYNDDDKLDVSEICKKYGGGGHKGASSMQLTKEQFIQIFLKIN